MQIYVTGTAREGVTELAAFDACLTEAGIGNLNLIYLSSIIPPGSSLIRGVPPRPGDLCWGDRQYCVMAQARTSSVGHEAWAGIGWTQEWTSGRGLFAEAEGASEREVKEQIDRTLQEMMRRRSDIAWGDVEIEVSGITCTGRPVCAISTAIYASESWSQ